MSSSELVKDRTVDLIDEETKRKLYLFEYMGTVIVIVACVVGLLSGLRIIPVRYYVIFLYGLFGIALEMFAKKALYANNIGSVMKNQCDPEKFLEIWDIVNQSWIGANWLKRYRYDYVYAHIITHQYDKAEQYAKEYLTKKAYRLLRANYLASIYYNTDREKFPKCYEEGKALAAELKLKGDKVNGNEIAFKYMEVLKCLIDEDYEEAKILVMQILGTGRIAPVSKCGMLLTLGNIEDKLGNKLDAAICYNDAYEIGPKLKRTQEILPRLEELKASYGEKKD